MNLRQENDQLHERREELTHRNFLEPYFRFNFLKVVRIQPRKGSWRSRLGVTQLYGKGSLDEQLLTILDKRMGKSPNGFRIMIAINRWIYYYQSGLVR